MLVGKGRRGAPFTAQPNGVLSIVAMERARTAVVPSGPVSSRFSFLLGK
jgi:hypothetical protein